MAMTGREKCEILRDIRVNLALMNGIDYTPAPCPHEGHCLGTCPQCDMETIQLYTMLQKLEASGVRVKIDVQSLWNINEITKEDDFIYDNDDTCLTGCMASPDYVEERLEEQAFFKERDIDCSCIDSVNSLCKGCIRYETLQGKDGKPIRCAGLSEHFFQRALVRGTCWIRTDSEDDETELDRYGASHGG